MAISSFQAYRAGLVGGSSDKSPTQIPGSTISGFEQSRKAALSTPIKREPISKPAEPIIAKPKENLFTKLKANPTYQKIDEKMNKGFKDFFSLPDKGIKWAQDKIVEIASQEDFSLDNHKFLNALAETQKFTETSPVFVGEYSPFSGLEKGAASVWLGNSDQVAETLYTRLPQKQTKIGKGIETVGELVGMVGAMMAGGSVMRAAGLAKATLPTLFVVTGQTGARSDLDWKSRVAKVPVDAVAGYLFSLIPGATNPFTKTGLKEVGATGGIAGAQTFINHLTEGLSPSESAKAAAQAAIAGALFHMAFTATNSEFRKGTTRMTPAEAKAKAAELSQNPEMKGPAANLFKAAEQAEAAGKDLEINLFAAKKSPVADLFNLNRPQGISGSVTMVDPLTPTGPTAPKLPGGSPTAPNAPGSPTTSLTPLSVAPTAETSGFAAKIAAAKVGEVIDLNKPDTSITAPVESKAPAPVTPEPPKTRGTVKVEGLPDGVRATASYRPDGTAGMSIHIDSGLQGKGYGTQAVKQLETKLIDLGIKTVNISADRHTVDGGQSSVGFWEKMGYTKSGEVKGDFQPMTKDLSTQLPTNPEPTAQDVRDLNKSLNQKNAKAIVDKTMAGEREDLRLNTQENVNRYRQTIANDSATPNTQITIYRGGTGEIKAGDFVTTDLGVAEKYVSERAGAKILTQQVALKDLVPSGGLRREFIYAPKSEVSVASKKVVEPKEPKLEPKMSDQEVADATGMVQSGIYAGEIDAAKELYDDLIKKGIKLPSFDELQSQVEESQRAMIEEIEKELSGAENLDPDSPDRALLDIARRLGQQLKVPRGAYPFTGRQRVYTDSKGNEIKVGGTLADAMDRLVFATDIDGFAKTINVMHEKFNSSYTELSDRIKRGDIDGGDYEKFKQEFRKQLDQRPTYSARSGQSAKSRNQVKGAGRGQKATGDIPGKQGSVNPTKIVEQFLKDRLGSDVFKVVEPVSGLWESRGRVIYIRPERNNAGFASWLGRFGYIEKVQEAGGNNVYKVTLDKRDFDAQVKKASTPSGYASSGTFIEESKTKKEGARAEREKINTLHIIEFPEMVKIVKELTGNLPRLRNMRTARGKFNPITQEISLNYDLFQNEKQAARTLAHEIGHLVDFLSVAGNTMKRGNLLGRLASLNSYKKQFISDEPPAERDLITPEDRKALMKRARELAKEPVEVTKEVVVGETKISPDEVLAIWKDTTAGERDPELLKYIQTLSSADKVDIAKAALKGVLPDWVKFTRKKLETITVKEIRRAPADIRKKYKELLREEIKKRRLVSLQIVRKELKDLSFVWRPLPAGAGAEHLKYRNSSAELYADAISVLFNDPVRLQEDAPVFYRAFFNYLSNKPAASEAFFDAWHLLNQGEDAVLSERLKTIDEMFKNDEAKFQAIQLERYNARRDIAFELKHALIDKNQAVLDKVKAAQKRGVIIPDDENPKYLLESYNYVAGKIKAFLEREINPWYSELPEQGLTWEDVGKYMMLERIMDERKNIANPLGLTKDTAKPTFDKMVAELGEERAAALKSAVEKFREVNKKVMEEAFKDGELYKQELYDQIKDNKTYASFRVTEYLENNVSAKIFKQVGTFKDIGNPATATLAKMIATIRATERAKINRSLVKLLREQFKEDIELAPTKWNGRTQVPIESKDPKKSLIYTYEKGKLVGYYVDPFIADAVDFAGMQNLNIVLKALQLSNAKVFRPFFITYNLGFQLRNLQRDFVRLYKNQPGLNPLPIIKGYAKAIGPSFARARGQINEVIQEMEAGEMLSITYNDVIKGMTEEDHQMDMIMNRYLGLDKKASNNPVMKVIRGVMDAVETSGNFFESLPKVAGYQALQDKMTPAQLADFVRTKSGSPDFLRKSGLYYATNNIFLFSNAAKEGMRGDYEAFTDPKTRAGYWFKTALIDFLPKIFMKAATLGLMGAWLKRAYDNISEYNKANYNPIVLGIDENGKTIWVPSTSDETGKLFGGIFWKMMNVTSNKTFDEGIKDIFSFMFGRIPQIGPAISASNAAMQYIQGQNPYDFYRNRNIIPEDQFKAGGWYSFVPFAQWELQQMGLSLFLGNSFLENTPNQTMLEKVINLPVVSNVAQAMVRVTDYGQTELNKAAQKQVEREEARTRIENRKLIETAVGDIQDGASVRDVTDGLLQKIQGDTPMTEEKLARFKTVQKALNMALVKANKDPNINALIYATSNKQKAMILKRIKESVSESEYNEILREGFKNSIISEDVIVKMRGL